MSSGIASSKQEPLVLVQLSAADRADYNRFLFCSIGIGQAIESPKTRPPAGYHCPPFQQLWNPRTKIGVSIALDSQNSDRGCLILGQGRGAVFVQCELSHLQIKS